MRMDRCGHQACCRKDGFGGIRPQRIFLGDGARPRYKAIAAIEVDRNTALIGFIIQDIIHDAVVNRRGRLSYVALGFLNKISQAVAG